VYRDLIVELQRLGTVLTEHIAHPTDIEQGRTDREIYQRDMAWLESADAVVAEVTTPSLGVGYEIAAAERMGKPILCLFRPSAGRSLSAMIAGSGLTVVDYDTIPFALTHITRFLGELSG
jgi:nucleoside 2-deoxyribosyltransferase